MPDPGLAIALGPVDDFVALAGLWRDLEQRADGSFFQSWAWTGCLAEERFPDPWLLSAYRGETVVALALFNRRKGRFPLSRPRLLLGESGDGDHDSIFIEHNAILTARGEGGSLAKACWVALDRASNGGNAAWVLSGIPADAANDLPARRSIRVIGRRPGPYLDFGGLQSPGGSVLDNLSANARQQIRRSLRGWEASGPLRLDVAETPEQADSFLDALKDLHQRYWTGRGKTGAFATAFFERFHRTLMRRAAGDQRVDLIRVSAAERPVGYLYNMIHRRWVAAYQSGFDFGPDADKLRPGLVTHLLAIEHYRQLGMDKYDFLGGESRYKRSFANGESDLLWVEAKPRLMSRPALNTLRGKFGA